MNWKDANVEKPVNGQICVVFSNDAPSGSDGYMIGKASVYGREHDPQQGMWSVEDGCGGYYPGDDDASDYTMKNTFWYPVLAAPLR
jgi:hypothetical protein